MKKLRLTKRKQPKTENDLCRIVTNEEILCL